MHRTIEGPDKEWLNLTELSKWLGIGTKTIKALMHEGQIPRPVKMGHKTYLWHWRDALGISIALSWRERQVKKTASDASP